MKAAFVHLGFPGYFRTKLAIAKIIGVFVLLIPFIPKEVKDMAYVGFSITFISAFIAHTSSGDPVIVAIKPVIFLGLLLASFIYYHKYLANKNIDSDNRSKEQRFNFQ